MDSYIDKAKSLAVGMLITIVFLACLFAMAYVFIKFTPYVFIVLGIVVFILASYAIGDAARNT